jgi:glycosyltransferase involved in cell wall biosynthesis
MTPRVSVVVASYNYGRYIGEALESVRAQTMGDWEVIIIDDGSTDDTLCVARPFLRDARFRLVQLLHQGQPRAKNRGIIESRGAFIAFLDADDRWRPTKLDRQLGVFANAATLGVCFARRSLIDAAGQPAGADRRPLHRGNVLEAMYRDNFVCFSSAMIRRACVEHVGGFDERLGLAIDYDWWLRMARHYRFDYVDEPLVEYRVGHANLSRRVADRLDTALAIMTRFRRCYDRPTRLNGAGADRALAETLRHRGIVARQVPGEAVGWLARSMAVRPFDPVTWRALASASVPKRLRGVVRRLAGRRDWEADLAPAAKVA